MNALKLDTRGRISQVILPDSENEQLEAIHQEIDGFMELVRPKIFADKIVLLADDEGLLKGKHFNQFASALYGYFQHGNPIVGDVLVVGIRWGNDGEEFRSLSSEEMEFYCRIFKSFTLEEIDKYFSGKYEVKGE